MDQSRKNRIAQWVFDTRPMLLRFHLWLEDVEETWRQGGEGDASFVGAALERAFIMSAGVTALGTWLFGGHGDGKAHRERDKAAFNRIKKDADAVSAYALSEALWYLTRNLPENHALMVSAGEGLMPKAGESPEMGSNPLLGFGRVYARAQVGKFLDRRVHRLLNDPGYGWDDFTQKLQAERLTVWGAAIDTLENTTRFAAGENSGPMTLLHLYDQPLTMYTPYEGYFGNLILSRQVVDHAARESVLIDFHTPRRKVVEAIRGAHPEVPAERIHVWTLGGRARVKRLQGLWRQWHELGVHLVEPGWKIPGGGEVFTDSGTYAPVARVGSFADGDGRRHYFLCDGYSASAEAVQAASLDPIFDNRSAMCLFSSTFKLPWEGERRVMRLDPDSPGFAADLRAIAGEELEADLIESYRAAIGAARAAGLPCDKRSITIDDFFARKDWRVLAVAGYILDDPYTGLPGVEEVGEGTYRVTVRSATRQQLRDVTLTLKLLEPQKESRLVFSPLLNRFFSGQDFRSRAVKVSDSGRLRNELQTLCSDALEYFGGDGIRVHMDRIDDAVMPPERKRLILEVLRWYKEHHPVWFQWLELPT